MVDGNPKKDATDNVREKKYECPPKVKPATMTDKEVKRRTGFNDRNTLLVCVCH